MSLPRTSLCSVLRLRPVFEGAGEPTIFSVSEPRGGETEEPRRKLGIFLCPGAYMEETVRTVTPCTSLGSSVLRQQAVIEGRGSSKFFHVPESIWRRAWNFSNSLGRYTWRKVYMACFAFLGSRAYMVGKFGTFPSPRGYMCTFISKGPTLSMQGINMQPT